MRIAVMSDIHGNLEALSSVIVDIRNRNVDRIICLGDVVGYGSNPNECIRMVEKYCDYCLLGNHEFAIFDDVSVQEFNKYARLSIEWTRNRLNRKSVNFMKSLELIKVEKIFTAVHATPYNPHSWYYISSADDAQFSFNFFSTKFFFIVHTHVPGIIVSEKMNSNISIFQQRSFNYEAKFQDNAKFIINVGSVGQPRDKNPESCYVIFDTDYKEISFLRIPYDIALCQRKMRSVGIPDFQINRIAVGY
jgi:predicted phosphodiesterase